MSHETEFRFLQTVLQKLHLSLTCLTPGSVPDTPLDMGLRRFLGQEEAYDQLFGKLPFQIEDNTVCKITDNFLCRYLFLRLPGKERRVVLIGPYMTTQLSREQMLGEAERYGISPAQFRQLEAFYGSVPVLVDEGALMALVTAYADLLWGGSESYTLVDLSEELASTAPLTGSRRRAELMQEMLQSRRCGIPLFHRIRRCWIWRLWSGAMPTRTNCLRPCLRDYGTRRTACWEI